MQSGGPNPVQTRIVRYEIPIQQQQLQQPYVQRPIQQPFMQQPIQQPFMQQPMQQPMQQSMYNQPGAMGPPQLASGFLSDHQRISNLLTEAGGTTKDKERKRLTGDLLGVLQNHAMLLNSVQPYVQQSPSAQQICSYNLQTLSTLLPQMNSLVNNDRAKSEDYRVFLNHAQAILPNEINAEQVAVVPLLGTAGTMGAVAGTPAFSQGQGPAYSRGPISSQGPPYSQGPISSQGPVYSQAPISSQAPTTYLKSPYGQPMLAGYYQAQFFSTDKSRQHHHRGEGQPQFEGWREYPAGQGMQGGQQVLLREEPVRVSYVLKETGEPMTQPRSFYGSQF
jgi:hypothetical protein